MPHGSAAEADALKARIVAAVTVEPDRFDRAEYDRLTARWEVLAAVGADAH